MIGLIVGALLGLVVGLIVHAIFNSDGALTGYEVIAGLCGAVFGSILGAFYGGALSFGRDRSA